MTSTPWLPDSTACPCGLNGDMPATQAVGIGLDCMARHQLCKMSLTQEKEQRQGQ